MMLGMRFGDWIRRLFSSSGTDDEGAQREEYGIPDRGEAELERDRLGRRLPSPKEPRRRRQGSTS